MRKKALLPCIAEYADVGIRRGRADSIRDCFSYKQKNLRKARTPFNQSINMFGPGLDFTCPAAPKKIE